MDKDVDNPFVTVLMPVFNAEAHLIEAMESILHQTYTNFEFLIINDGSTDQSVEVIQSFQDTRIRLIHNNENIGLTKSLNRGLKMAEGKYIARMDADDISDPERLNVQVGFMEKYPDIAVAGTWFYLMFRDKVLKTPVDPEETRIQILFKNPIGHPTVMMRKDFLEKHQFRYNEKYRTSQDQELWYHISKIGKITNIPEVLLKYRRHVNKLSFKFQDEQTANSREIQEYKLCDFTGLGKEEIPALHYDLINNKLTNIDYRESIRLIEWFDFLREINDKKEWYDSGKFISFLSSYARKAVNLSTDFNASLIKRYRRSALATDNPSSIFTIKLWFKRFVKHRKKFLHA